MSKRLSEADGRDHSRLAWLYLHLNDVSHARVVTEDGLSKDPSNEYLQKLKIKLTEQQ